MCLWLHAFLLESKVMDQSKFQKNYTVKGRTRGTYFLHFIFAHLNDESDTRGFNCHLKWPTFVFGWERFADF